jgi:hypothetical protein
VTLAACGRIGFDPLGATGDGRSDDGGIGTHVTYFKASNTDSGDEFGTQVALSGDGSTLAVSARYEASVATGVDGNQLDNSFGNSGAVYVFARAGTWSQQAYIKASNTDAGDAFGYRVAISADGNTIAVSTPDEDGGATGVNGNNDNLAIASGAAYVFVRTGSTWSQQAYIKASNTENLDRFGVGLALSGDGNTLAVGASDESSAATGIAGNQADGSALRAGAIYVFVRTGSMWSQQEYVKASNTNAGDKFGTRASLSFDGNTLAVGAINEASGTGAQADNSAAQAGAVYVFTRASTTWSQQAYVKPDVPTAMDQFGFAVSLASDGNTLAVGTPFRNGASGAAYVFARAGTTWSQQAQLGAANADANDGFARELALSSDGNTLVAGAAGEASAGTGPADNSLVASGAAYVFSRSGASWSQRAYVKAPNPDTNDGFGTSVSIGTNAIVVGAFAEASAATGVDGVRSDNSAAGAGAAYLFE